MLGILLCMSGVASAEEEKDSFILGRIYQYQQEHQSSIKGIEDRVYSKIRFNVEKRNLTLWLIPHMYSVAKDPREYIRESYSTVTFKDAHHFDINEELLSGTIRHNRQAMPTLLDYMTPNIYEIALYDGHMLSPFNRTNRKFYRFSQKRQADGTTRLDFRPKLFNTQLLNGYAIVETATGRIIRTLLNGEFDMITFRTEIRQGEEGGQSLMPQKCSTAATFRFMGNRVTALFDATYQCKEVLPDSIDEERSRELIDSIRPIPLSETDKMIYQSYDRQRQVANEQAEADVDTLKHRTNILKKIFWDTIGDGLVTPIAAESNSAYFRLSPIINPLYVRYSKTRGLSYKMRFNARYTFSPHRYLTLEPTFGYNFKQRQFYFTAPLRMTYNPKRNGYAEIIWGNGNHISNSSVAEVINQEHLDTLNFDGKDMDKFKDNHVSVFNNIMLFDWLDLETGFIFHQRKAINRELMHHYGMPEEYRSFAPNIGLKIRPWTTGPLFSIDWERGLKTGSTYKDYAIIDYERWEADASWKIHKPGLRLLNLRFGMGFYGHKEQNYFVDYTNFRDNNLPEGWDDDWSGDFQLLSSSWYNTSNYYVRGNVSYESPLLLATWTPYLGKYIEKERFYANAVLIEHTRPYMEIGYGFTNRYISVGAFASFLNGEYEEIGFKFDIELFKRW